MVVTGAVLLVAAILILADVTRGMLVHAYVGSDAFLDAMADLAPAIDAYATYEETLRRRPVPSAPETARLEAGGDGRSRAKARRSARRSGAEGDVLVCLCNDASTCDAARRDPAAQVTRCFLAHASKADLEAWRELADAAAAAEATDAAMEARRRAMRDEMASRMARWGARPHADEICLAAGLPDHESLTRRLPAFAFVEARGPHVTVITPDTRVLRDVESLLASRLGLPDRPRAAETAPETSPEPLPDDGTTSPETLEGALAPYARDPVAGGLAAEALRTMRAASRAHASLSALIDDEFEPGSLSHDRYAAPADALYAEILGDTRRVANVILATDPAERERLAADHRGPGAAARWRVANERDSLARSLLAENERRLALLERLETEFLRNAGARAEGDRCDTEELERLADEVRCYRPRAADDAWVHVTARDGRPSCTRARWRP